MNDLNKYFNEKNIWSEAEKDNDNDNKSENNEDENININLVSISENFYKSFKGIRNEGEETIENREENTYSKNIEEKEDSSIKNKEKRENESKLAQSISNFIPGNNPKSDSEEVPKKYKCPQDNKLSGKQSLKIKDNLDETTRWNIGQKKGKINYPKFTTRKHGRPCDIKNYTTNSRKPHDKFSLDNQITKIKSSIFNVFIEFSNQLSEKITNDNQFYLHKICGYQAGHRTVNYDKELMKKQLKIILSDTRDDYNKNLVNKICINEEMNTFLELKLEDIFNYLRNKEGNRITETNKIIKDQYNFCFLDNLNFYSLYQNELSKRNKEDKEIIEGKIKEDFVKIINRRKSKKVETKNEK
jgi:hypothetical protein